MVKILNKMRRFKLFNKIKIKKQELLAQLKQIEIQEQQARSNARSATESITKIMSAQGLNIVCTLQEDCIDFQENGKIVDAITRDENGVFLPKQIQKHQFSSAVSHQTFSRLIPQIYNILKAIPQN